LISIGISSVFIGILVYSFTKTFGTHSDKTYGASNKKLYSKIFSEINFELGQKYSNKYKSLIGKDISVYTFKHADDMPSAFLIENNDKPDIYIEEDFIDELSSNEMDMLLLHELGHYKAHHERKKNTSVKIFIFSLLLLILSYTLYLNTNSIIFFYAFALFFPGLAIAIIVYLVILISIEQISADRFALGYMKDNENYLKFLEKLKLYTNSAYYTEKQKKYAMKDLDRRIKKIKGKQ
jgi:Zn-dependent protease with chaperone function